MKDCVLQEVWNFCFCFLREVFFIFVITGRRGEIVFFQRWVFCFVCVCAGGEGGGWGDFVQVLTVQYVQKKVQQQIR